MNTLKNIAYLALIILTIVSCTREYDAPPLPDPEKQEAPVYDGKANITIAELKEKYAAAAEDKPLLIDVDYIVRGYVTSSDQSGNIFKQLYIQDETGGINIGIDQNSLYSLLRPGQEIFIELHGFYIIRYADQLQIGDKDANANRLSWKSFELNAHLNDWPDEKNIPPLVTKISDLKANMVNMLVRFDNVSFVNGGLNAFTKDNKNTNEPIKDSKGNTIDVRTSSYASFAEDELPEGKLSVVGILGRFYDQWQLTLRSLDDISIYKGPDDPEIPTEEALFYETFGTVQKDGDFWPRIDKFTNWDMKAPVQYADAAGTADVRSTSSMSSHVWFPSGKDAYLTITGINTSGKSNLTLSFELAAHLPDNVPSGNLNIMSLKCNDIALTIPNTVITKANEFHEFKFKDIPAVDNLKIEFYVSAAVSNMGLRLDNIKIQAGDGSIVIEPSK